MIILSFDTSTEACSAALWRNGVIDSLSNIAPKQHTSLILPMIQTLLDRHQLKISDCTAIAFGEGPGSFTGLRIAAGVAQGLAFAHQIPIIPISTLAALALAAKKKCPEILYFVPLLDARMNEVYFALYSITENIPSPIIEDTLASPLLVSEILNQAFSSEWIGIGPGFNLYAKLLCKNIPLLPKMILSEEYPNAVAIAELACQAFHQGKFVSSTTALPKYLRNNVTHKSQ